ncbi:hypothetical protein BC826DRAFT_969585 [Russula brevipes]|nr:hypothetical protein BC826DRAFT_969585 [Russula brevipes]
MHIARYNLQIQIPKKNKNKKVRCSMRSVSASGRSGPRERAAPATGSAQHKTGSDSTPLLSTPLGTNCRWNGICQCAIFKSGIPARFWVDQRFVQAAAYRLGEVELINRPNVREYPIRDCTFAHPNSRGNRTTEHEDLTTPFMTELDSSDHPFRAPSPSAGAICGRQTVAFTGVCWDPVTSDVAGRGRQPGVGPWLGARG